MPGLNHLLHKSLLGLSLICFSWASPQGSRSQRFFLTSARCAAEAFMAGPPCAYSCSVTWQHDTHLRPVTPQEKRKALLDRFYTEFDRQVGICYHERP